MADLYRWKYGIFVWMEIWQICIDGNMEDLYGWKYCIDGNMADLYGWKYGRFVR